MNTIRTLILSALMLAVAVAYGQSADSVRAGKEVVNAQMIGVGAAEILDTYLSPEKYKGTELRYISHTIRCRGASRWSRMLVHQGSFIYADNRSGNGGEMAGMYTFTYGLHYNWRFLGGALRVMAGGHLQYAQRQQPSAGAAGAQHCSVGSRGLRLQTGACACLGTI